MIEKPRHSLRTLLVVILLCIGLDQITKIVARSKLPDRQPFSFAADTVRIQYAENKGAFLGFGSNWPPFAQTLLFLVGTGGVLVWLTFYLIRNKTLTRTVQFAFALIIGGGVGNLIDRASPRGSVTDFLNVGIGSLRTGIFNVADMAITFAVVILLFESFRKPKPDEPNQPSPAKS